MNVPVNLPSKHLSVPPLIAGVVSTTKEGIFAVGNGYCYDFQSETVDNK